MKKFLLAVILIGQSFSGFAQNYQNHFNEAYQLHPNIPKGVLEGIAWGQTRITHITSEEPEGCSGIPPVYGVMGLTADGKGFLKNNLTQVSMYSDYSIDSIVSSPRINILAYAKAFEIIYLENYHVIHNGNLINDTEKMILVQKTMFELSELPDTGAVHVFARNSQVYQVLKFMMDAQKQSEFNFLNYNFDLELIFGEENLKVLSATRINLTENGIADENGNLFFVDENEVRSADYAPALWVAAPTCNYSSRSGTPVSAITIHTIQGTYAGAISWAQNCASSVSYHYVIRSSDGQITQLVLEANKAWHVGSENPYTVGYEHDGYVSQPQWYTTALYTASAGISRDICNSGYGISPLRTYFGAASSGSNVLGNCTRIKGHQHYPNQTHTDPGIYWNWEYYYQLINNSPTTNNNTAASGNFYDTGGAAGNYADDERYLTLIAPTGATTVTLTFTAFNIENNWDYMYIHDGNSLASPIIGTYTGTNSPGTVTSTGGSLLIEFRSDCSTTSSGWAAAWTSNAVPPPPTDNVAPTTAVSTSNTWVTQNFTTTFTDADNSGGSGLEKSYYQVIDYDGTDWRANANKGFFSDNFDLTSIHADWTSVVGAWNIVNGELVQSDQTQTNTNLYATVNHSLSNRYLYHWAGKMEGTGTNRRAGLHYFSDQPNLSNRGNGYFVWFRLDSDKVQLYKVTNDVFTMIDEVVFDFNVAQWYDYKVIYDRISGKHQVYIDNNLVQTYTDATPYSSGNYISFRNGDSKYTVNNLKVYRSRNATATIEVGATGDLRYQNTNPLTAAGRLKSIVQDVAGNLSSIAQEDVNVDWTAPSNITTVNDGIAADISVTYNNNQLSANWSSSTDTHSDIARYWYAIGTTAGGTEVLNFTDNAWYDSVVVTGLNLNYGTTYYFTVKSENGAGLMSGNTSSNGQTVTIPFNEPIASYNYSTTTICQNGMINFTNNSTDATTYSWNFPGGNPTTSSLANPSIQYSSSGTFTAELIATGPGGDDTLIQTLNIMVEIPPVADFSASADTVYLPNGFVGFTNNSINADGYAWNFGDGNTSNNANPWNQYAQAGVYTIELIAVNSSCDSDTMILNVVVLDITGVNEISHEELLIFPNPAHEMIWVKAKNGTISIYDAAGKLVYSTIINSEITSIDLNGISSGIYFVEVNSNVGIIRKKLLKE